MQAWFRFYAELNDFLLPAQRGQTLPRSFYTSAPVKDLIEGFGVPHTEVELVVANGESVDFRYLVQDSDRISVYPVFEAIDVTPALRVRPEPLRDLRFALDVHLGRLAAYLRMAGFDVLYRNDTGDAELERLSADENRVLLTRDRRLLMRSGVTRGYYLRSTDPARQFSEVLRRFDLAGSMAPFTRCLRCNAILETVTKETILDRLPERAASLHDEFRQCPSCRRVYWQGSHYRRMRRLIDSELHDKGTKSQVSQT